MRLVTGGFNQRNKKNISILLYLQPECMHLNVLVHGIFQTTLMYNRFASNGI